MSTELSSPVIELNTLIPGEIRVIRRNGKVTPYDPTKISVAVSKAFLAVEGDGAAQSSRIHEQVAQLTDIITQTFHRRLPSGGTIHIEDIQDQVELCLMRSEQHKVARAYVLYREERRKERESALKTLKETPKPLVTKDINSAILKACEDIIEVNPELIRQETERSLFEGATKHDINKALQLSARALIEKEPNYTYVAARLLLDELQDEAYSYLKLAENASYADYFKAYITQGIKLELLNPELAKFDLTKITQA